MKNIEEAASTRYTVKIYNTDTMFHMPHTSCDQSPLKASAWRKLDI
jgi:hypothetical protein